MLASMLNNCILWVNSFLFIVFFYKMVCANMLPSKHSYENNYLHAKILYCIGKRISFKVGIVIQDKIINQSQIIYLRIGFSYGCLITQLILVEGVKHIRDYDSIHLIVTLESIPYQDPLLQPKKDRGLLIWEPVVEELMIFLAMKKWKTCLLQNLLVKIYLKMQCERERKHC